jgi:hypothetical protein
MKLKNEYEITNSDFLNCSNCNVPGQKLLFSQICNHRICEPCFNRIYLQNKTNIENCKFCGKPHEIKDYKDKHREEIYYNSDLVNRARIVPIFYKTATDFNNQSEYDDYLEEIEEKCKIKKITLFSI